MGGGSEHRSFRSSVFCILQRFSSTEYKLNFSISLSHTHTHTHTHTYIYMFIYVRADRYR